jgi:hypothetical protein
VVAPTLPCAYTVRCRSLTGVGRGVSQVYGLGQLLSVFSLTVERVIRRSVGVRTQGCASSA